MTVGILVVTHEQLGAQLVAIAKTILCTETTPVVCVSVPANISPQQLGKYADLIRDSMIAQDDGAGVLVLTDVYGATADNLARYFAEHCDARVISGVNLPMLLRVLNYSWQTLPQLCDTAVAGAKSGIQQYAQQAKE
ncbi:MAG: PTS fructose transporter subunit IIA [Gammaproteobacteria bacterium]|jgi:PTS system ascorbate-specific IIA component|nr:PTS fructose transporter subunit IIA [Gammaproteobacteria bacterium]